MTAVQQRFDPQRWCRRLSRPLDDAGGGAGRGIELDPPVETGRPVVALRSMYVAPDNADTAEVHWTDPAGQAGNKPAVGFGKVQATAVGFERSIPSKHNTSAPDILFEGFEN